MPILDQQHVGNRTPNLRHRPSPPFLHNRRVIGDQPSLLQPEHRPIESKLHHTIWSSKAARHLQPAIR